MPIPFSSSSSGITIFEIRVNEDHLVLRGGSEDANSVLLKGTVILSISEPISKAIVRLKFYGDLRACFANVKNNNHWVKQEHRIRVEQKLLVGTERSSNRLEVGNHELDFEFQVPGHIYESIEGLPYSWLVYRLKAELERGVLARKLVSRKHIRIIRTFEPTSLALFQEASVDKIWVDKIKYTLSTPTEAVVLGSKVECAYVLIPLKKGLKIGRVRSQLWEQILYEMAPTTDLLVPKEYESENMIVEDDFEFPEDTETEDIEGLDGYRLSRYLQMPRKLGRCMQTIEAPYPTTLMRKHPTIRIKHHLKFVVSLINPCGHTSELRAKLPIKIFISPNLRLNEHNEIVAGGPFLSSTTQDSEIYAPPGYGDHLLDQLYNELPESMYFTPAGSGTATPIAIRSNSNSAENLVAMNNSEVPATSLHSHLSNIVTLTGRRRRAHSSDRRTSGHNHSSSMESSSSDPPRPASAEEGYFTRRSGSGVQESPVPIEGRRPQDPFTSDHIEYDNNILAKVPSYNTAVSGPLPRTSSNTGLPSYAIVASRPPSPGSPPLASSPDPAEMLANRDGPSDRESDSNVSNSNRSRRVRYAAGTRG